MGLVPRFKVSSTNQQNPILALSETTRITQVAISLEVVWGEC